MKFGDLHVLLLGFGDYPTWGCGIFKAFLTTFLKSTFAKPSKCVLLALLQGNLKMSLGSTEPSKYL